MSPQPSVIAKAININVVFSGDGVDFKADGLAAIDTNIGREAFDSI
jgi:hypothetical protein